MSDPRTVLDYITLATKHLQTAGVETPRLDAEVLLGHVLDLERIQLYVQYDRPLLSAEVSAYRSSVARRARREPVAYIVGRREFRSVALTVDHRVLIPRPETEMLVDVCLEELSGALESESQSTLADVGTGSGAVAVSLALEAPSVRIVATDVEESAIAVAQENAKAHQVFERIQFRQGDLLEPLANERFDGIVSNPPYVPEREWVTLEPEVRDFEPQVALIGGGDDGLATVQRLVAQAPNHLHSHGFLCLEIGSSQGDEVQEIARRAGFAECRIVADLAGRDRIAVMRMEAGLA